MALVSGGRLGVYEILGPLGAGGMGEVYRAVDTNLKRAVAIKVLPDAFGRDPDRLARFRREAEVLASLNHPNIATVYGLEASPSGSALVMELVEGPTLADRIAQGPIAADEAMAIARQIAQALEAAHDRGIIHRDLKPANIKLREDGTVKVLDFGLAKLTEQGDADRHRLADSPTVTSPAMMTGVGVLLGTAAYMSPEQARGKAVDRRADIWAFGVIVYEMVTGRRPFGGDSTTDVLASVVKDPIDLRDVQAEVQPLLKACLEKDPARRLRDIGDLRLLGAPSSAAPRAGWHSAAGWTAAGVMLILLTALAVIHFREGAAAPERVVRFAISPGSWPAAASFAISQDGRLVAYQARGADGLLRIWIRPVDGPVARPLPGTEGVTPTPMWWSPDSRHLAFGWGAAGQTLKRVEIATSVVQTVVALDRPIVGGFWSREDVIVFGVSGGPIMRVAAVGGTAAAVTSFDASTDEGHRHPALLPDGRHFLYRRSSSSAGGIYVGDLQATPEAQGTSRLSDAESSVAYAGDEQRGHLLFVREGTLFAQPFDARARGFTGEPAPVVDGVGVSNDRGMFSVSSTGDLLYRRGAGDGARLAWFTEGRFHPIGEPGLYQGLQLSPDEKIAAMMRANTGDVWIMDLEREVLSRFTSSPGIDANPVFSGDGRHIAFSSARAGAIQVFMQPVIGEEDDQTLLVDGSELKVPTSWHGEFLLYTALNAAANFDVHVVSITSKQVTSLLASAASEERALFSPDGRWIAYVSNETGRADLYVREFIRTGSEPAVGPKHLIAIGPVLGIQWTADGKVLHFVRRVAVADGSQAGPMVGGGGTVAVNAVDFSGVPRVTIGRERTILEFPSNVLTGRLARDGKRALVLAQIDDADNRELNVVLNWRGLLPQ